MKLPVLAKRQTKPSMAPRSKVEDAMTDTAFRHAHFEYVVFENISGTHHNMIDNPELVTLLRRWSYSGETPA
jgi:hypothetical protein